MQNTTERDGAIEHEVKALLARSAAWQALPQEEQTQLARDMVKVAVGLVEEKRAEMGGEAAAVDAPGFVAGVVQGVFQAIVDASAQQMKAYGELLAWIAGTVEKFAEANVEKGAPRRKQDLLETMVSAGINRIVVTDGDIKALRAQEAKPDGEDATARDD